MALFFVPLLEMSKRIAASLLLDKPDARFASALTVTVRLGYTVRVIRGDFSNGGKRHGGKRNVNPLTGSVLKIESNTGRLFIEGAKGSKSDNKEEAVPVHSSNVVVVKLDETDKLRVQQLTGNRS